MLVRLQQPRPEMVRLGMLGQQLRETLLREVKETLVMPERVVRIETDRLQISCHMSETPLRPFPPGPLRIIYTFQISNRKAALAEMTHSITETDFRLANTPDFPGDDDGESDVIVQTKPKTKRPPLYKVLLLNDDYTPMEFVVHVLERFFGMNHAQAFEIMLTVHKKGVAVVGVFSHEIAETKVGQVMDFARRHQHPLQCTMEKE